MPPGNRRGGVAIRPLGPVATASFVVTLLDAIRQSSMSRPPATAAWAILLILGVGPGVALTPVPRLPTMVSVMGHRTLCTVIIGALALGACGTDDPSVERSALRPTTTVAATSTSAERTTSSTTVAPTTVPPTTTPAPEPARPANVPEARSPQELAERLTAAELTVRNTATAPDVLAAAAFEQQQLYRQLARTEEWHAPVNDALPAELRSAMHHNVSARNQFRSMHRKLADALPAWRIVDPPPPEQLLGHYREGEALFGVPWNVLAAVNLVETGMGRIRGTSVAGAQGPMQFMPATWAAFGAGGNIEDFRDSILGAARYLAHNGGGSGDIDSALWNYNHSNRYVEGVKHYAAVMADDPQMFHAYYHWQIVYLSKHGDVWLPAGYDTPAKVPVDWYIGRAPHLHLTGSTD